MVEDFLDHLTSNAASTWEKGLHRVGRAFLKGCAWTPAHVLSGHAKWLSHHHDHGSRATGWLGAFWQWWSFEFVNSLVADTYGVLLIVLLTKWFYERGSDE